jgi:hypothetical protein
MKDDLEQFIKNNRDSLDRETPDPAVLQRILGQMQQTPTEKQQAKVIRIPVRVLQWAAACIIVLGGTIAFWASQKQPDHQAVISKVNAPVQNQNTEAIPASGTEPVVAKSEPVKRSSVDSVDDDLAVRKRVFLARLQERPQVSKKLVTLAALTNMDSPASRITAATEANQFKNTANDVVDALVQTLNTDPNANVRMAALDGLAKFYRDQYVRKKLITSLKKQKDPVVQIALIDLLTRMRESSILTELDQLVGDENTEKAVKDCAYSSMLRLKSS